MPAREDTAQRTRADAITVTADLDAVAAALRSGEGGWAELEMQIAESVTARVYVNARLVRYLREA